MFSSIWNDTSVSGKRRSLDCPTGTPRNSAISRVRPPCALPENTFSSPKPVAIADSPDTGSPFVAGLAGAEGFEPSNTGSKVPRLTAWPRPTETIPGAFQSWRYGPSGVAELPSANRECIRWVAITATFGSSYKVHMVPEVHGVPEGAVVIRVLKIIGTQSTYCTVAAAYPFGH